MELGGSEAEWSASSTELLPLLLRHFLFLQRMPAATMSAYFSAPRQILKNGPKRQNNNNVKAVAQPAVA